ncbi:hypothetical protein HME9302_00946 [Alteripontixanthobacter maritimus]|uniref:Uncharacterized protein n=1 Tax=Alteripontixanthobacter maritimus TaxID=2161824 RepID=A0A369Q4D3_9SPHN|nr:hypothetical protein [Alteripontixanthobacter maritimus]RDC59751.1 hypothetical protein HME9302_00946 [Alteripontixanthobacter maritimus]
MTAPIGHNNPPPIVYFSNALDDVRDEAANYLDGKPIETQAQADAVGLFLSTARKIKADADKVRKAEKEPHLKAGKAVDAEWKPIDKKADDVITAGRAPLTAWLQKLEAIQAEEARKAREEADRQQQAAIEARRASEGNLEALEQANALQDEADRAAKDAKRAEKVKPLVAGEGRSLSLRSRQVAIVTDRKALLEHVMKTDPNALTEWLEGYATRALPSKLPGVEIETQRSAA